MGKDDLGAWGSAADYKKTPGNEEWRSGSMWNCFAEMDVCWMTTFCFPCMVGREWSAAKRLQMYNMDTMICMALTCCGCVYPCVVCNLRGSVRKIGDASTAKDNPDAWIPGSAAQDFVCALFCPSCTVCHMGRELKVRGYAPGTLCDSTG
eukprot:Sspe_Gene.108958::Locus_88216_Transcript_1_1_Confidence_1.000_Length_610::g.108958::m.108958